MPSPPSDRHALIQFIAWYAGQLGRSVSRIRLIKFLYLADVHHFAQRRQLATGYRWRFYHYGPYAPEAQQEIDECVHLGLIECHTLPRSAEAGDVSLYRAHGGDPLIYERFTASLEASVRREIKTWIAAPLNAFLDYVYFDTPPMRDARRGEVLRFEEDVFRNSEPPTQPRARRYASRQARQAFQRFLASRRAAGLRVSVPRDAIVDEPFVKAVEALDAEDHLARPLEGTVDVNPNSLTDRTD